MRKTLLFFVLLVTGTWLSAQNVPNRGFENWTTNSMGERLVDWNNSNAELMMNGHDTMNVTKSTDAYHGNYSALMETVISNGDTMMAYMICGGNVSGDTAMEYIAGVPFTDQPDSLHIWMKYSCPVGDSGLVLAVFKNSGAVIQENWYMFGGSASGWTRMSFPMQTFTQTPDTVLVAIATSNPDNAQPGGWALVDAVTFTNATDTLYNWSFEQWAPIEYDDPDGWQSTNAMSAAFDANMAATMTTDANSGQYALMIEPVFFDAFGGKTGFISTGNLPDSMGFTGGFPFTGDPTKMSFYYKYNTLSTDTAMVFLILSAYDSGGDSTVYLGYSGDILLPTSNYTYHEFNVSYNTSFPIDTANVIIVPSKALLGGNPDSIKLGSVLYVDDLWIHYSCDWTDTTDIWTPGDSVIGCDWVQIDAPSGYSSYSWSTGDTTASIIVSSTGFYTVTLMDTAGCMFTDSVFAFVPMCPGFEEFDFNTSYSIYPNPFNDNLNVLVDLGNENEVGLAVYDLNGRMIVKKDFGSMNGRNVLDININDHASGIYILELKVGDRAVREKVVKY